MATLEQIQAKLKKLQAQAEMMVAKKSQVAIDKIRELMLVHGLTTADIEAAAKLKRESRNPMAGVSGTARAAAVVKAKGAPKYQDPKTGATWSGLGRAPGWIAGAKDRTKFLITRDGAAVEVGSAKSAAKSKSLKSSVSKRLTAKSGQPKGPQPALYRDPASGATWSGRGRAPAWLETNRSKFRISDAAQEVRDTAAAVKRRQKSVRQQ